MDDQELPNLDEMFAGIAYDVDFCPRCDGQHEALMFKTYTNAPDDAQHWAMCPETQQPIQMEVILK